MKAHGVIDTKKVWNWTTVIISGGLTIAGLFVVPKLVASGVIVGVVGAVGSLFFDDFEVRKKKARLDMKKQLYAGIDKSISQLRKQLKGVVTEKIVEQQLRLTSTIIGDVASLLFDLSAVQRRLGKRINAQQGLLNSAVVDEAIAYLGYNVVDGSISKVARIPGEVSLLVLADGTCLPSKLKGDLAELLNERIRYVSECDDIPELLSRTIDCSFDLKSIRIEELKGEPLVAHIGSVDKSDNEARTGMRLGVQVTELLITR